MAPAHRDDRMGASVRIASNEGSTRGTLEPGLLLSGKSASPEDLAARGKRHRAERADSVDGEPDVNRPIDSKLRVLLRSIERIDDPDPGFLEPPLVARRLFAQNAVLGITPREYPLKVTVGGLIAHVAEDRALPPSRRSQRLEAPSRLPRRRNRELHIPLDILVHATRSKIRDRH